MPSDVDGNPTVSISEEFDGYPDEVTRSIAFGNRDAVADTSALFSFEPNTAGFEPAAAIRQCKGADLQKAPLLVRI